LPSVVQYSAMPLGSAYGTPGPPFEYRYAGPDDEPWSPVTIYAMHASEIAAQIMYIKCTIYTAHFKLSSTSVVTVC